MIDRCRFHNFIDAVKKVLNCVENSIFFDRSEFKRCETETRPLLEPNYWVRPMDLNRIRIRSQSTQRTGL